MKRKIYYSRAPLRIGISGGGSDFKEFIKYHNSHIINGTINLFNTSSVKILNNQYVIFNSIDLNIKEKHKIKNIHKVKTRLNIHYYVYLYMMEKYNNFNFLSLEINSFCEAPYGSGLGSSSTLVVSIIKCLSNILNLKLSKKKLAEIAYDIERNFAGIEGGMQDQYSAVFGGINEYVFSKNRSVKIKKIKLKKDFIRNLENMLTLAYYPISRNAIKIISDQKKKLKDSSNNIFAKLLKIKKDTLKIKKIMEKNNINGFIKTFKESWKNKKNLSKFISNSKIDKILDESYKHGAIATKISGAGGGGFFIFISHIENKKILHNFLKKNNLILFRFIFTKHGVEDWVGIH